MSYDGGLGDCILATAFLMEASTPFVSCRAILANLGNSVIEKIDLILIEMCFSIDNFRVEIKSALPHQWMSPSSRFLRLSYPHISLSLFPLFIRIG